MPTIFDPLQGKLVTIGAPLVYGNGAPTSANYQYSPGTFWLDTTNHILYFLGNVVGSTATWDLVTGGSGSVTGFTADSGTAAPSAGNINELGGTGLSTVASGSTVTFNVVGGGFKATVVTGATVTLAVNQRFLMNRATAISAALPTTSAVDDAIMISGEGAGLTVITQAAGQQIVSSGGSTTLGAAGTLTAQNQYDSILLLCIVANTIWKAELVQGGWTTA